MLSYAYVRVTTTQRNWQNVSAALHAGPLAGADVWGQFAGMFGIGSNEFVVVLHGQDTDLASRIEALGEHNDVVAVESYLLAPTVRPTRFEPRQQTGLYVFRFFDTAHSDMEQVASLSNEAWETFESADSYDPVPQALFRTLVPGSHDTSPDANTEGLGKMLLCTWYDSLASWVTSRQPAPEARANFQARHALTQGTIAFATQLVAQQPS